MIDYVNRQRVKIWGEARIIEDDPELLKRLLPQDYRARPEQVILLTVAAWDANCPQHIPQRFDATDVAAPLTEQARRIAMLQGEVARLQEEISSRETNP